MNQDTKIILGIFAGLAAGAALGLLFSSERKNKQVNGHTVGLTSAGQQSEAETTRQLEHIAHLKERLMNTFEKDDFADHVEHV
ncbi:YtxH domain-containing protein [Pedobacter gandavensis]|uniref:YtxH domain-containing protein n=1 Tax=Pedobacter gandavensis TaxID=2679963 RepID=UPI00292E4DA8|nr:YtxH domain-containing protein [Pedobacter gandavensis]